MNKRFLSVFMVCVILCCTSITVLANDITPPTISEPEAQVGVDDAMSEEEYIPDDTVSGEDIPEESSIEQIIPDNDSGVHDGDDSEAEKSEKDTFSVVESEDDKLETLSTTVVVNGLIFEVGTYGAVLTGYDYKNTSSIVTIPEKVNGKTVHGIGDGAFRGGEMKEIYMPDTIVEMGQYVFWYCFELEKIAFSKGLTYISAVNDCRSLQTIELPEGVTKFGGVSHCEKLVSLKLPASLKYCGPISETSLTSLVLPESLTEFVGISGSNISELTIPKGLHEIDSSMFSLPMLNKVTIPDSIRKIDAESFGNSENLVIYGITNSEAERFANNRKFDFVEIREAYRFPKKITVERKTSSNLQVSWNVVNEVDGYQIFRKKDGETSYTYIGMTRSASVTGLVDKNLSKRTTYSYMVRTYMNRPSGKTYSNMSQIAVGKTGIPGVENLKATNAGKNKVKITWSKVKDAEGYLIYAQKSGKYGYCGMTAGNTYTDTKALDTEYTFYWVFSYEKDEAGKMLPTSCEKYVYAKGILEAVTNLKVTEAKGKIIVSWDKVKDAEGYIVYRKVGTGSFQYRYILSGTSFPDTTALKKQFNYYRVYPYYTKNRNRIAGTTNKYVYGHALFPVCYGPGERHEVLGQNSSFVAYGNKPLIRLPINLGMQTIEGDSWEPEYFKIFAEGTLAVLIVEKGYLIPLSEWEKYN